MDPIAHTLVGASLAETPLKRLSALAAPTLILGANAPDIDALTIFLDRDISLGFRRGWTHGILAIVFLPLIVTGLMLLLNRIANYCQRQPPRIRVAPLIVLSYIGVLTHPVLDWLNTYGIRLLMPFDGQWFYGDTLFIIDPWIWLLAGTAVVLAHTKNAVTVSAWLGLCIVLSVFVTGFEMVPTPSKLVWIAGVSTIVGVRIWCGAQTRLPYVATLCLVCVAVYVGAMLAGSRLTEKQAIKWLSQRGAVPIELMVGPLPANPFAREIIFLDQKHYHFLEINWLRSKKIQIRGPSINRDTNGPIIEAARNAMHVRGLMNWIRFPAYTVEDLPNGYRVTIRDVRFAQRRMSDFGSAVIELNQNLTVRSQ